MSHRESDSGTIFSMVPVASTWPCKQEEGREAEQAHAQILTRSKRPSGWPIQHTRHQHLVDASFPLQHQAEAAAGMSSEASADPPAQSAPPCANPAAATAPGSPGCRQRESRGWCGAVSQEPSLGGRRQGERMRRESQETESVHDCPGREGKMMFNTRVTSHVQLQQQLPRAACFLTIRLLLRVTCYHYLGDVNDS